MARVQVVVESPSGSVQVFDTNAGTIPINGRIEVNFNELGRWNVRGIGWNLCDCALTDEFSRWVCINP